MVRLVEVVGVGWGEEVGGRGDPAPTGVSVKTFGGLGVWKLLRFYFNRRCW